MSRPIISIHKQIRDNKEAFEFLKKMDLTPDNSDKKILEFLTKFFQEKPLSDGQGGSFGYGPYADSFSFLEAIKESNENVKTGKVNISSRSLLKSVRKCIFDHNFNIAKKVKEIRDCNDHIIFDNKTLIINLDITRERDAIFRDLIFGNVTMTDDIYQELAESYDSSEDYEGMLFILREMEKKQICLEYCYTKLYFHYLEIDENEEKAEEYLKEGLKRGFRDLIYHYGEKERILGNYISMKNYYGIAAEKKHYQSAIFMAKYHLFEEKDFEMFFKFIKLALEINKNEAQDDVYRFIKMINPLEQYYILSSCDMKVPQKLLENINVIRYKNKCNMMEKEEFCAICFDTKSCIPTECCHYFCKDCYPRLYTTSSGLCPTCRCKL